MQANPVQIIAPQTITDTLAGYYTSPAKKRTLISKLTFSNAGIGAESVDIHLVPDGGTAGSGNKVVSARTVNNNETIAIYQLEGQVMQPGDSLHIVSDTIASSVVVVASGVEIY